MTRSETLSASLSRFLDRYSPPRSIAGQAQAQQDEVDDMIRQLLKHAPRDGVEQWASGVFGRLAERMQTRSWPTVGELVAVCREHVAEGQGPDDHDKQEVRILGAMTDWFERHGGQMPSFGSYARTAALIRSGTLRDEREARFYGFDLGEEQKRKAFEQRMSEAEWHHHVRVMARLLDVPEAEAERQEIEKCPRSMPEQAFRRAPSLEAAE